MKEHAIINDFADRVDVSTVAGQSMIAGCVINKNPLWLNQMYVKDKNGRLIYNYTINKPEVINKIPLNEFKKPDTIKWKSSEDTLDEMLRYLYL